MLRPRRLLLPRDVVHPSRAGEGPGPSSAHLPLQVAQPPIQGQGDRHLLAVDDRARRVRGAGLPALPEALHRALRREADKHHRRGPPARALREAARLWAGPRRHPERQVQGGHQGVHGARGAVHHGESRAVGRRVLLWQVHLPGGDRHAAQGVEEDTLAARRSPRGQLGCQHPEVHGEALQRAAEDGAGARRDVQGRLDGPQASRGRLDELLEGDTSKLTLKPQPLTPRRAENRLTA
mmetsp:Transcript_33533/g.99572  ORF Transcript_33533/g.99572 Transcript_33533/m.99572 type:complete len:237 (-) Transcript_33533:21-731(-)